MAGAKGRGLARRWEVAEQGALVRPGCEVARTVIVDRAALLSGGGRRCDEERG